MSSMKLTAFALSFLGCYLIGAESLICATYSGLSGRISDSTDYYSYNVHQKCWKIKVPESSFALLNFTSLNFSSSANCDQNYLKLSVPKTFQEYKLCRSSDYSNSFTALSDITVTHYFSRNVYGISSFDLEYIIQDVECVNENSFRCSNHSCISKTRVCDGVKDCKNGEDEIGCETGVLAIEGVSESSAAALSWLKGKWTSSWGWREDTSRAVVALYLASGANFNGTDLKDEVTAKQVELKIAVALLRPSLTNNQLSMFVNALLVTCHDPRHFYGNDLIKRLKKQIESSRNTHPAAYLALCNADEPWPLKAIDDLTDVLNSSSEYPFLRDIQAMAVMAISCKSNYIENNGSSGDDSNLITYLDAIARFKRLQMKDGSFGNVYTTALITQALISSGQENSKDWKLNATVKYLMKELNSSSVDFLSTYLTLPILNGKSLTDISKINCSANSRKSEFDIISDIHDYVGPKIQVQYSLFVGDEKDVVHTISLRVPENYTAFEVMELAAVEDQKYRFQWKLISEKIYIYDIAQITNDPEDGKFWLLYLGKTKEANTHKHLTNSPDEVILEDGEHLIMWYKTAHI